MIVVLGLVGTLGCGGPDYALTTLDDAALTTAGFEEVSDLGDGGAVAAWELPALDLGWEPPVRSVGDATPQSADDAGDEGRVHDTTDETVRVEVFVAGPAPTAVADYLFVIDESVSMRKVMRAYRQGLWSLAQGEGFPRHAQIAVMNTTPGDPDDLTEPHPAVRVTVGEAEAPGFLHLVDGERITHFRTVAGRSVAERYGIDGCSAWFAPGATNAEGVPCLVAHGQTGFTKVRAEAGLVALSQWLEVAASTFRAGAAANVIFLSDTHDPGLPPTQLDRARPEDEALLALQPQLDELRAAIDVPLASFRIHAIVPESRCAEPWEHPSYTELALESGGQVGDICTLDDYTQLLRRIARTGAHTEEPVLRLGTEARQVLRVEVDGQTVPHEAGEQVVVLPRTAVAGAQQIRVAYTR